MFKNNKKLASDTLSRESIESSTKRFVERHCDSNEIVYDIGGVPRYPHKDYFNKYLTVNFDKNEKPDIVANAEHLPFRNNSIGNMLYIALLEHVENPITVIKEMYRVLRPKGRALIWVPFYWREHNYPIDNYRFTENGILTLLRKEGFNINYSSTKPYSGFFFVMAHNIRFMIEDPHNCSKYNPLIYAHSLLQKMTALDRIFKLKYPHLYTGTEVIVEKQGV